MKSVFFFLALVTQLSVFASMESKISKEEYVENWREIAVRQMIDYKIPASITMAQGILESGNGNSELAKKGNNHFGIKCHDWTGDKMYMNDDEENECFRVYASAEDSYVDHSVFLKNKNRYSSLFSLELSDYQGWAKGLKEAGYATNPKYPELLIELIEKLNLSELDKLGAPDLKVKNSFFVFHRSEVKSERTVLVHENEVKYIKVKKGDTFYRISQEFELSLSQLYSYNDFGPQKDILVEGDIVYLESKSRKSRNGKVDFKVLKSSTLRQVSQETAIKLETLQRLNGDVSADVKFEKGEVVKLKGK